MPASSIPQTWYVFLITLPHLGITGSPYYLAKRLLSNLFARDAERFKAELKRSADVEIERLKAFLTRLLGCMSNKFRRLQSSIDSFVRPKTIFKQ
jgi:hypothetical protein